MIVLCFMAIFLDSFTKSTKALQGSGFFGGARKGSVKGSAITKFGIDPLKNSGAPSLGTQNEREKGATGGQGNGSTQIQQLVCLALYNYNRV